jgi:hypothetical protein
MKPFSTHLLKAQQDFAFAMGHIWPISSALWEFLNLNNVTIRIGIIITICFTKLLNCSDIECIHYMTLILSFSETWINANSCIILLLCNQGLQYQFSKTDSVVSFKQERLKTNVPNTPWHFLPYQIIHGHSLSAEIVITMIYLNFLPHLEAPQLLVVICSLLSECMSALCR